MQAERFRIGGAAGEFGLRHARAVGRRDEATQIKAAGAHFGEGAQRHFATAGQRPRHGSLGADAGGGRRVIQGGDPGRHFRPRGQRLDAERALAGGRQRIFGGQYGADALAEAETAFGRIEAMLDRAARIGALPDEAVPDAFGAAMDDDLNTAQALGYLFETVRLLNRLLEAPSGDSAYLTILKEMHHEIVDLGWVLNLLQADPVAMVASLRQKAVDLAISPEEIQRLIDERTQARKDKDWARADAIRKQLTELDILLEDTPQGTIWKVKS